MARKAFYSFHYDDDNWRASQVRSMGVIEGNEAVSDNDWEKITEGGDEKIQSWIDGQIEGKSCTIVLIGGNTAGRKWIKYEIMKSWNEGKGLVGIHIHNLKDVDGKQSSKGRNPLDDISVGEKLLSSIVKTYNPVGTTSKEVYSRISDKLKDWVEEAISIRDNF